MSDSEGRDTGWTEETLKLYLEQHFTALSEKIDNRFDTLATQIEALDRLTDSKFVTFKTMVDAEAEKVALALSSADKAVTKAEVANEERFRAVNEFRTQILEQASHYVTRTEADAIHERYNERISDLTNRMNREDGKSLGSASVIAGVVTVTTIIITIVIFVINFYFSNR